ncbi:hypothetical protein CAPTEDRAFT_224034 [Capitella teleta]|uniref:Translin-associated protein X n=1 Tax=Capitella teleta TaxID=283909 RepID=R7V1X3_CAPTE|nr:hypothetical protein CAPTEDRAFT_224034 [Capitella teleta]|eukprot:ELU12544.1 hypothetical protein CAPTEDRAFT_224034 [Capitella teleta]
MEWYQYLRPDCRRDGGKRWRGGGSSRKQDTTTEIDESNPIMVSFKQFQIKLDSKHDKHERIVKLSRDITIESKRAIFLLHRANQDDPKACSIIEEAEGKLHEIKKTKWVDVAKELMHEDIYQFLRAYSPGLQEYIEAVTFLYFMKTKTLMSLPQMQSDLTLKVDETENSTEDSEITPVITELTVPVPPVEYLLGIADLTGELMRMAIRCVSTGSLDVVFDLLNPIKSIHDSFVQFGPISRELPRKLNVLRQSLMKVEAACYTLKIRGSEFPKHMLVNLLNEDHGGGGGGPGFDDEGIE